MFLRPSPHLHEAERIAVLQRCGILDSPREEHFDCITALAASIAGVPIGLVSLVDRDRQWFKSAHGLQATQTPREVAFCAHAINDDAPLFEVEDARRDQRFADNPLVVGQPHVIFYAGVPLRVGAHQLPLGTLCVIDHQPRQLTDLQRSQLRHLARQVELLLEQRLRERELEDQLIEKALHQDRNALLTKVAAQVPGMVYQFLVRPDGSSCFPYSSDGIIPIYGVTPTEVVRSAQAVIDRLHPDDHARVMDSIRISAETLGLWSCEYRYRHPDGRTRWLHGQASPERCSDGSTLWHGFITDIGERKEREFHLAREEARFRLMVEGVTDYGIFMLDKRGHVASWNPGARRMKGYAPQEIIGQHFSVFYPTEDRWICAQALQGAREAGHFEQTGWRLRKDGSRFWANVIITPIALPDGTLCGYTKIVRDITDRLVAEKTDAVLGAIIDAANVSIIATTIDGIITHFNSGAVRMLGYQAKEMVGKQTPAIIHTADEVAARAAELSREYGRPIEPGFQVFVLTPTLRNIPDEREWTYVRKDGSRLTVHLSVTAIRSSDGTIIGYLGIASDMSVQKRQVEELRQAQQLLELQRERMTLAMMAGDVGIWDYEVDANRLTWDERMYRLYGIPGNRDVGAYETWSSAVHPDDIKRCEAELADALKGDREFDTTFRIIWPDKSTHYIRARALVKRDPQGQAVRMIGTNWDITRETLRDEELHRAMEAARAGAKAKAEFLATMSHEIRTPMNGVIGMTSLLMKTALDPLQRDYLDTLQSCGESLLTLINDILDVSKLEAGRVTLEDIPFSPLRVVEEVASLYQGQAHQKGISLELEVDGFLPCQLRGDPIRIRQVLLNLTSNAVKFTSVGGVSIGLRCIGIAGESMDVEFFVKDTGVGMTPQQMERLGEAFTQADSSTTREYGGTGLGMTISKAILALMQSELEVSSRMQVGSVFSFRLRLPLCAGPMREANGPSPDQAVMGDTGAIFLKRVLVVEDTVVNQRVIRGLIKDLAGSIQLANNGVEAVAAMEASEFDCVLMDCQMPVMDGYEATRRIRELEGRSGRRRTPIIALTAHALGGVRESCLAAGMDDYLSKPLREEALLEALARHCVPDARGARIGSRDSAHLDASSVSPIARLREQLDDEDIRLVAEAMVADFPQQLADLEQALAAGDRHRIGRIGHSFKGAGANICLTDIEAGGRALESMAGTAEIAALRVQVDALARDVMSAVGQFRQFLATGDS